jgi:hypothetical protein
MLLDSCSNWSSLLNLINFTNIQELNLGILLYLSFIVMAGNTILDHYFLYVFLEVSYSLIV